MDRLEPLSACHAALAWLAVGFWKVAEFADPKPRPNMERFLGEALLNSSQRL
jgi:hypothetical protein